MARPWIAQLRDDLKGNEVFNSDDTRGDFANARLAIAGRASNLDGKVKESDGSITDLTTRLENAIPELAANATQEQTAAIRQQFAEPKRRTSRNYRQRTDGVESRAQMTAGAHDAVYAADLPGGEGSRARARTECLCFLSRRAYPSFICHSRPDPESGLFKLLFFPVGTLYIICLYAQRLPTD